MRHAAAHACARNALRATMPPIDDAAQACAHARYAAYAAALLLSPRPMFVAAARASLRLPFRP